MCLLPALAPMFDASCAFHQHNRNQDVGGKVGYLHLIPTTLSFLHKGCEDLYDRQVPAWQISLEIAEGHQSGPTWHLFLRPQ